MFGVRRAAVVGSAFLLLSTAAWATAASPQQHVLPAGSVVVFVTDASLDTGRREGDVVRVHLRNSLLLDGTILAAAGTRAELVVGGITAPDGKRRPAVSIERFSIDAGLMPVKAVRPIVAPVAAGAEIEAVTMAEVDHIDDRWSIRIPFPFRLSGDQPASAYTPTPARTPPPRMPAPNRSATPAASAPASAAPAPDPAATKIPAG